MRGRRLGSIVPIAVIGVVAILVVPMPTVLLDMLLTVNIAFSVLLLLAFSSDASAAPAHTASSVVVAAGRP